MKITPTLYTGLKKNKTVARLSQVAWVFTEKAVTGKKHSTVRYEFPSSQTTFRLGRRRKSGDEWEKPFR